MTEPEQSRQGALARDLASGDAEVRRLAIERFAGAGAPAAAGEISCLLTSVGDESWRVRKAAVAQLVRIAERPEVVAGLITGLADADNSGRRNSALEALIGAGRRVVPAVIAELATDDVDVRKQLVDVIAGIGDAEVVGPMLYILSDADVNVAAAAADALGTLGGEQAISALTRIATDDTARQLLRVSALRALVRLEACIDGELLVEAVDDAVLRPAAFALMGHSQDAHSIEELFKGLEQRARTSKEAAIEALLRRVASAVPDEAAQIAARVESAIAANGDFVEWATDSLPDGDLKSRLRMIHFFGLARHRETVVPILRSASDDALREVAYTTLVSLGAMVDRELATSWQDLAHAERIDACRVMGRLGEPESASRLIAVLSETDAELRCAAARALAERRHAQALPVLLDRLGHVAVIGDDEEREAIAASIAAISAAPGHGETQLISEVVAALGALLAGGSEPLRYAVAQVLVGLSGRCDSGLLARLSKDESPRVRRAAVEALAAAAAAGANDGDGVRIALADESPSVRVAAARALGREVARHAASDLLRVLDDPDATVRAAAVQALARASSAVGGEALREGLIARVAELSSDEADVAISLLETLESEGGRDVDRVAAAMLGRDEPEVLEAAIRCVGIHADRNGLEPLVPLVSHESWVVRASAIEALGARRFAAGVPAIIRQLEHERDAYVREAIQRALARFEE